MPRVSVCINRGQQIWTKAGHAGVLDTHEFDYSTLTNAEIRAGDLAARYDAIILPDFGASGILKGHATGKLPPEYVGGIGTEGLANLRAFVEDRRNAHLFESFFRTPFEILWA